MKNLTLKAAQRDILGKKTRFLRRQGITPTHLLGHGLKSLALQCDTTELARIIMLGGTTRLIDLQVDKEEQPRSVFIREIQRDEVSGRLLHVDFYQIKMTEKITADIPIVLIGEAPATKSKGNILQQTLTHLGVECLPDKLPPRIEIDINPLEETDQAIYVRDLHLDPDISITTAQERLVVKISQVMAEKEEEVVAVAEEEVAAEAEAEAGAAAEAQVSTEEEPKGQQ
ncbi:MAG: 50S ribosomal protein L25 [Dehalococcoidales bacterium]